VVIITCLIKDESLDDGGGSVSAYVARVLASETNSTHDVAHDDNCLLVPAFVSGTRRSHVEVTSIWVSYVNHK
jgi:hypothetical protein